MVPLLVQYCSVSQQAQKQTSVETAADVWLRGVLAWLVVVAVAMCVLCVIAVAAAGAVAAGAPPLCRSQLQPHPHVHRVAVHRQLHGREHTEPLGIRLRVRRRRQSVVF
jgi:hypothetical protein